MFAKLEHLKKKMPFLPKFGGFLVVGWVAAIVQDGGNVAQFLPLAAA
jgi:hypothetical protein